MHIWTSDYRRIFLFVEFVAYYLVIHFICSHFSVGATVMKCICVLPLNLRLLTYWANLYYMRWDLNVYTYIVDIEDRHALEACFAVTSCSPNNWMHYPSWLSALLMIKFLISVTSQKPCFLNFVPTERQGILKKVVVRYRACLTKKHSNYVDMPMPHQLNKLRILASAYPEALWLLPNNIQNTKIIFAHNDFSVLLGVVILLKSFYCSCNHQRLHQCLDVICTCSPCTVLKYTSISGVQSILLTGYKIWLWIRAFFRNVALPRGATDKWARQK